MYSNYRYRNLNRKSSKQNMHAQIKRRREKNAIKMLHI